VYAVGTAGSAVDDLERKGDRVTAAPMTPLDLRELSKRVDVEVPKLDHIRSAAIQTWRGRMQNEYGSAAVFEALSTQMERAGFDAERVATCRGFADEERNHGVLGGAVVEALGGEAKGAIQPQHDFPMHEDASPIEGVLRNLLSVSCLSETIAVSLIGAEREEMPEGSLRELLTGIWADEIGHARFGWKIVNDMAPSLDAPTKERLGDYLRVAFGHLVEHELAHLPLASQPPAEGVQLGLCSGGDARALFFDTVETVIVPALEASGIPARAAWETRVGREDLA
jgi:hypothetical protein